MSRKSVRISPSEISKRVVLSFDGKQLTMRVPRKISDYMGLKKGDSLVIFVDTKEQVKNKRHHTIKMKIEESYGEDKT